MKRAFFRAVLAPALVIATLVLSLAPSDPAAATTSTDASVIRSWGVTGTVDALLVAGDSVFVGGTFSSVTDPSGNTYPISNLARYVPSTSSFDTSWHPQPDKNVAALATSADGSELFIGGDFTSIGATPASKIAEIDVATGLPNGGWAPSVTGSVNALLVANSLVYVGGNYSQITDSHGAHSISYLARISATTGLLDPSWTPAPDNQVRALAISADGMRLFAGGDFTAMGGKSRPHLASLSTQTGALMTKFRPAAYNMTLTPVVLSLAVDGPDIFIGAGGGGGACASENATSGALNWAYHTNGDVQAVSVANGTVWCGGHFDGSGSFAGESRKKLAAVNESDGTILPYAPIINSALGVWSLAASGSGVYAGGDFTTVTYEAQPHFAYIMPAADVTSPWVPADVEARSGSGSARLFWDVPYNDGGSVLKKYAIYREVSNGPMDQIATTTGTSYTNGGLTNGVTYQYAIEALNAVGNSQLSPPLSVTPQPGSNQVPTAPRAMTVSSINGHAVLTWSAPADNGGSPITGYTITRATTSGQEVPIGTASASATSYVDATSAIGNVYYYQVLASNSVGASAPSNEYSVLVSASPPAAPVLTASVTGGGVSLSWTTPASGSSAITKYTIVRSSLQIAHPPFGTNSYLDSSVPLGGGVTYTYQVRATNAVGNGPLSSPVQVTP